MSNYSADDIARAIIAMYLSNALQNEMEKKGFVPIKTGQDPMAMMGGAPPGMLPGGPGMGPMPPGGLPPEAMLGPPGGPGMGPMPPGGLPPEAMLGPPGGAPPVGGGDLGSLLGLLGAMPPPPPPGGEGPSPEGAPEKPPEEEIEEAAKVTATTLYAELVKVRKLLLGLYDALKINIPSDALSDEEAYLGGSKLKAPKEEIRESPKEREKAAPMTAPVPEGASGIAPEGSVPPEAPPPVPPEVKSAILKRRTR